MTRVLVALALAVAVALVGTQAAMAAKPKPAPPRIAAVRTATLEELGGTNSIDVDIVARSGPKATARLSAALRDGSRWRPLGAKTYALPVGHGKLVRRQLSIPLTGAGLELLEARDTATVRIQSWRTTTPRQVATRTVSLARTVIPPLQTTVDDHGASAPAIAAADAGMAEIFGRLSPANQTQGQGLTVVLDIIPYNLQLTDLPEYAYLAGHTTFDGRRYEDLRGLGGVRSGSTIRFAVGEEQLTPIDGYPPGYGIGFILAHEAGHIVNDSLLTGEQIATAAGLFAQRTAAGGPWLAPDWYTASSEDEYFAQSNAAWFGHSYYSPDYDDEYTPTWLQANDPGMAQLLGQIYQ